MIDKCSNISQKRNRYEPEAQGEPGTLRMIADNNGVYFPAYDPNGNVMGLVKASDGTVCAQYEYLPYGEQVTATGTMAASNPIRFSTKYYDTEARLYYYGYRYYSPDMGRWLSRDPIEEQGGLNLYGFVNNDPVNKWDLWGMKNYKLGDDDPEIPETQHDEGSGEWRRHPLPSELEGIYDSFRWNYIYPFLAEKQIEYPNAVAHFRHFLGNTGGDYTIKLEKMLAEVDSAQKLYDTELSEATNFVKNLKNPPGCKFSITSQKINGGEIKEDENKNWHYAVGKYYAWGKGVVEDCGSEYRLHFEYKFYDSYDWKKGKEFDVYLSGKVYKVKADYLRLMHQLGIAQEFKMRGSVKKNKPVHIRKRR